MAENPEKHSFVFDTSAFISLEGVNLLNLLCTKYNISTSFSAMKEIENFAQHDDELGKIAKRVLKLNSKIILKHPTLKKSLRHVSKTDEELFNLSLQEKALLITDDIKFSRHIDQRADNSFSTFFLTSLVASGDLTKKQALERLESLRDLRNWRRNIIYVMTKRELMEIKV